MLKIAVVTVTPLQQNCTILFDDESLDAVIVDPGGDVDSIHEAVEELKLKVTAIWLTHGHLDHAGGAEEAKARYAVDIIGPHKADKMLLDNIGKSAAAYGLEGMMKNASPDRWLSHGEKLMISGHEFEVLHCPGHAPGHVIFVNHAHKVIIMGDVLFQGSVGRTDLPGSNHEDLMASLKNTVLPLGDEMNFICWHGPASTIGHERQTNPFLKDL